MIPLPLSALLAPQPSSSRPPTTLPAPYTSIIGPLPPTSPFHLALNQLSLSDLAEFEPEDTGASLGDAKKDRSDKGRDKEPILSNEGRTKGEIDADEQVSRDGRRAPDRVLIVTGDKDGLYHALQEEVEDWMRDRAGDYGVMQKLKRVDIRNCPSPQHLLLLLSLLTSTTPEGDDATYNMGCAPVLIVLYDIAQLFMHWVRVDENRDLGEAIDQDESGQRLEGKEMAESEPTLVFNHDVTISNYLDLIAAAKAATLHLSSGAGNPTQLVVLEPNLSDSSALPVIPAPAPSSTSVNLDEEELQARFSIPAQSRTKKIKIIDGLSWILGAKAVGVVRDLHYQMDLDLVDGPTHVLEFAAAPEGETSFMLRKRQCPRGEWAATRDMEGNRVSVEGDRGGWRWEWYTSNR